MKAVRYTAAGVTPELVEIDEPRCPDDGVLVQVHATGVCRSDWHAWVGHDPVPLPMVPGHEFSGVVAAVGPEVRRWSVGDRVTVPFVLGCGHCEFCLAGDGHVCPTQEQPGFTRDGSFAELVALPRADFNLVALPAEVGDLAAASLGCRLATAYRALTVHGRLRAGQWVAVFGCGGVGLSAVMIAVALGGRVIAVDPDPRARAAAADLGAEHLLSDPATAPDEITALTGGGAHAAVEAIGRPEVAAASVRSLRRRGRHVQVGLLLGDDASTALPMDLVVARELTVVGSHGMPAADYPGLLALAASGALRPDRLVGRVIGLDEAGAALVAAGGRPVTGEPGSAATAGRPGMTVVDVATWVASAASVAGSDGVRR
ncbi:alcohol dehydrogenase catalytic domain-containing protein [Nakamurella endophytica]|uniref:Alcohol dehydrogenase n=1 Tax=Nakamurella endophytica TaxID=1748367 RepID=A0A917SUQ5_9ACTN|nr:alcohol dehydrogenase catalytic domain-containing protein [Nakamurella endophytica]GGL96373.1 alcohol dehydrogenase [Nakamurella endophytica]